MQSTVEDAHDRRVATALLSEYGLPDAQEYVLQQLVTVGAERDRRMWSRVLQQLEVLSHPIRFRQDLQALVLSGAKTATTRRSVKVPRGGSFWVSDMGTERMFRVTNVHSGTVGELSETFWRSEGFDSPVQMVMELARIYPTITSETTLVTHVFEEVPA